MNRRVVTLVPILLGGAAGALLGLFEVFPRATPEASAVASSRGPAARPATAPPLATNAAAPPVSAELAEPLPAAPSAQASAGAAGVGGSAALAPAPSPGAPSAPPKRAFDLAEPTTQEALLAAQVQCNRSSPEDCERAAFALESGSLGIKDAPRARSLRRIALTLYVKQCETARAVACARLAEMYDVGDIVQANPRSAQALRARFAELCAKRPSEPGCQR